MERELLEEVVVEPGAGGDADAARAVEREPHRDAASRRSRAACGRAGRRRGATGDGPVEHAARAPRRAGRRPRVAHRDRGSPSAIGAHDEPLPEQRVAERRPVLDRDEEEVRVRRERLEAERPQRSQRAARAPRPPAPDRGARRARRARAPPRASRRARAPGVRSARRPSRARRARSRCARRRARRPSRRCAARSRRRRAGRPPSRRCTRSTPRRRRAGARRAAAASSPVGLFGRQAKVSTGSSSPTSAPASCAAIRKSG